MILRCMVVAAVCVLWGCTLESSRAGQSCKRSTQCQAGLACVSGKCSKDLGPIADQSTVPDLGTEMGVVPAADGGGVTAGSSGAAAGSSGAAAGTSGAAAGSGGAAAGSGGAAAGSSG